MAHVGRGVFWKKTQTEECLRWDMSRIAKDIDFSLAQSGFSVWTSGARERGKIAWTVIPDTSLLLHYTVTPFGGQPEDLSYYVGLERTPCYFGNYRWWFTCPDCHERCRILYLPPSQKIFACRLCHKLTYKSQQEGKTKWGAMFTYLDLLPVWEHQLRRSRSSKKRTQIADKMFRAAMDLGRLRDQLKREKKRNKR